MSSTAATSAAFPPPTRYVVHRSRCCAASGFRIRDSGPPSASRAIRKAVGRHPSALTNDFHRCADLAVFRERQDFFFLAVTLRIGASEEIDFELLSDAFGLRAEVDHSAERAIGLHAVNRRLDPHARTDRQRLDGEER